MRTSTESFYTFATHEGVTLFLDSVPLIRCWAVTLVSPLETPVQASLSCLFSRLLQVYWLLLSGKGCG